MIKQAVAKLLPKEDKFYVLIRALANEALQAAIHFKTYVDSSDQAQRTAALNTIRSTREASKTLSADITKELCLTFITPFDREDIQDFTISLYKIIKTITKISNRLEIHSLGQDKGLVRQADVIVQEAEAMQDMVYELISGHDDKRIIAKVNVLHDLENAGDAVLTEILGDLFRDENDIKRLILRKDLYNMMEKVIDRYRDAAATALQIVLKHS